MTNSWSLLFDELNMTEHSKYYYDYDRNDSDRKNPFPASPDTINFISDGINAAEPVPYDYFGSKDSLSFDLPKPSNPPSTDGRRKYSEDVIINELKDYITRTYDQHYSAGDDKIQTLDLIEACGDGEAFCRSNILKYASRYDKKGTARRDIMKILHYAVLLMHFNDKNAKRETYPQ